MRNKYVVILALLLITALASWIFRRSEVPAGTPGPSPTAQLGQQQFLQNRDISSTPTAAASTPLQSFPRPIEKPDAKLLAAKKHLPWASDEDLKALLNGGVNIENIERGRSQISTDLQHLKVAAAQYHTLTGESLTGGNANISKALRGENGKKQVFIDWPKKQLSQTGELLDPWGTPYEMRVSDDVLDIRSAGPDLQFGTADDQTLKP